MFRIEKSSFRLNKRTFAPVLLFMAGLFLCFMTAGISSRAQNEIEIPLDFNNTVQDYYSNTVSATVTDISAPVTFRMTAANGSGNYKYMVNTIAYVSDNSNVADPSRMPGFSAEPSYSFLFTASGEYYVIVYAMDMANNKTTRKKLFLTVNDPARPTIEAVADSVAAQCNASVSGDFNKALWLNDWLVNHTVYDSTYFYCSAEGCLTRGKGTCESYHRAYQMLLQRVGIESGRVDGNMHVWTAVKMDGAWYQVDVCWNDAGYTLPYIDLQHLYFGLTDSVIASDSGGTHIHPVGAYPSNATADNYFIKTGKIRQYSDVYKEEIRKQLGKKNATFSLTIQNTGWADNFKNIIYSLVAVQLSNEDWSAEKATLTCSYSANTLNFSVTYQQEPSKKETESSKEERETESSKAEKETEATTKAKESEAEGKETIATEKNADEGEEPDEKETPDASDPGEEPEETIAEEAGENTFDQASESPDAVDPADPKEEITEPAGTQEEASADIMELALDQYRSNQWKKETKNAAEPTLVFSKDAQRNTEGERKTMNDCMHVALAVGAVVLILGLIAVLLPILRKKVTNR